MNLLRHLAVASVILILSCLARAEDLYSIHRLSEAETLRTYTDVLRDACRYADVDWHTSTFDPTAGYWGDGVSAGNQGIRSIGDMVLASAALLKYDTSLDDAQRKDLLAKATASLRYIVATHVTGTQKCTNGKSWGATPKFGGESWQSGMWTGTFAFGAWLMWDKLDPPLRESVGRVVAWEDDVLADRKPPNGLALDTKAEENAWEVPCLVLGELMLPDHPHAARWHETAVRYMMNTLCTDADTHDATVVDGKPTSEWVGGANVQPDFTLENHNIFHPSYVGCSSYFLTQAAMYYTYAGRPIPQAATHHLADTWQMFRTVLLPCGESPCPQGMDWELHSLPFINLYASLATHDKDAYAACLEQHQLQYMRAWQKAGDGSLAFPGSKLGITRHTINAEQVAFAFVAHKVFGPSVEPLTPAQAVAQEVGVRDYPYVGFIAQRSDKAFVSFSWKNRLMALLVPIGDGHEGEPFFSAPIAGGLVGSFDLSPRDKAKPEVIDHAQTASKDGFEATATVTLNAGRLKQTLRVVAIGGQTVVYEDRVTAVSDVTVDHEHGLPVAIENDEISGGKRVVTDQAGEHVFGFKQPAKPTALAGSWANVDGRLGMVALAGSGMNYSQAAGYSGGISVCSDFLYGSFSDHSRHFKAGEEVAHRVAVFYVEVGAKETAGLAQACRIESGPNGRVLHCKRADGGEAEVSLKIERQPVVRLP